MKSFFGNTIFYSCLLLAGMISVFPSCASRAETEHSAFTDTDGNYINAHGGAVIKIDSTYYWYGEHRAVKGSPDENLGQQGVALYTSPDMKKWTNRDIVLAVTDSAGHLMERGCTIERPKVVYNPVTGKYVMWFHHELKGQGYGAAHAAVAVADAPWGPFSFVRSARVNPGIFPENMPDSCRDKQWDYTMDWTTPEGRTALEEGMYCLRDVPGGQMARDMTVFVDEDGKAYHIYSAEENLTLNIAELDSTYTNHTGRYIRVLPGGHNEAPTIFRRDGKYWMICSGCTGWDPNQARLMTADSIMGQWRMVGNPCRGEGSENTFRSQGTYIYSENGELTFMADRWNPQNLGMSEHLWIPVLFDADGTPYLELTDNTTEH